MIKIYKYPITGEIFINNYTEIKCRPSLQSAT